MKYRRPLLLAASTLALFISACSTPADVQAPLEPQFGTADEDRATTVAVNSAHSYVYTAGTTSGSNDGTVFLRRYNQNGSLSWERRSEPFSTVSVGGVGTDAAGNAYLAYNGTAATLSKLNKNGSLLWRKKLAADDTDFSSVIVSAFVGDNAGNSYVALQGYSYPDGGEEETGSQLRKYDPSGKLLWQRDFDNYEANFQDLAAASDGSLYSVSNRSNQATLLTKYSTGGTTLWQVQVNDSIKSYVAARDGSVYVADESAAAPTYTEYSTTGAFKRRVTAPRFTFSYLQDVSVDASGNVYLTGFVSWADAGDSVDSDLVVQKHAPGGALLWVYEPRLAKTDEWTSKVAARTTGELYIVGQTSGKVNGQNNGGLDAFLLRLNAYGQKVWSR